MPAAAADQVRQYYNRRNMRAAANHNSYRDYDDDDDDDEIEGIPIYGGKFTEYDVCGNTFEVTAKYKLPPFAPIGRGAYGVVCSALNSETNEPVAIKKICNVFDNNVDAKRTYRELKILRHLQHENVIAIKDVMPPPRRHDFEDVYVSYELMDTDLHWIIRSQQALTEEHCKYFLYQILRGLKYIHSANVLHRDLKPGNLLVNANCDLKICDFGLARIGNSALEANYMMTEYVVTRWYRAPELLLNSVDYTCAIDVWSVGCIYMELLNHKPLFPGKDYVHQLHSILEVIGLVDDADMNIVKSENARRYLQQLPRYRKQPLVEKYPELSPLALDLVDKMLTFDPSKRISVEEALAHPYLAMLHDVSDEPNCLTPFTSDVEEQNLPETCLRELIYKEALYYNPDYKK